MGTDIRTLDELECGDIIKLNFSPTEGHEQGGYRPAVILTNPIEQTVLNGMVCVAPITKTVKSFPLHVNLDSRMNTQGTILMEHLRMVDLGERRFQYVERLPVDQLQRCKIILEALFETLLDI